MTEVARKKRPPTGAVQAFLADLVARKDEIIGCVYWPFARDGKGYAKINLGGKPNNVHRVVCAAVNGPPPTPKHQAAHNCGNGKLGCVSPHCVRWATQKENEADKVAHGTKLVGSDVGNSKIDEDTAREIHVLRAGGMTSDAIASRLNILGQQVRRITSGDRWSHVHPANDNVTAAMIAGVIKKNISLDCRLKVTDDEVRKAHVLRARGETFEGIAQQVGMNASQVARIIKGERRKGLHPHNDPITAKLVAEAA